MFLLGMLTAWRGLPSVITEAGFDDKMALLEQIEALRADRGRYPRHGRWM